MRLRSRTTTCLIVECPSQTLAGELTTPLPILGCSNAINLGRRWRRTSATSIAPLGTLPPSSAEIDAKAVQRLRDGKVITRRSRSSRGLRWPRRQSPERAAWSSTREDDEREPFAAYLTDDASQAAAQAVALQRGWSTANIRKGGPERPRCGCSGSHPRPLHDRRHRRASRSRRSRAGLTELARLGSAVMVLGTVNDVNYFRRIMRTGARDYLMKPVDADMLGEIFVRLEQPGDGVTPHGPRRRLHRRPRRRRRHDARDQHRLHHGREAQPRGTALVDMDIYAGNIALALDIEPDARPARGARRSRARRRDLPAERDGQGRQVACTSSPPRRPSTTRCG